MADCCFNFMKKIIFYICFGININLILSVKSNVKSIRDIPISGNRSIEECINGKPFWDSKSELFITTIQYGILADFRMEFLKALISDFHKQIFEGAYSQLVRKLGYPAEEHLLLTEDGYLLTMHRIPGAVGAPPVFLKHGITLSSFDWVVSGKGNALALALADKGYDVWIGNSRGNTYSQCHTKFTTSEYSYWNFSFHEMGIYDLPTEISYITNITNQDIMYVGHSMGTTMFYVFAIERPDIASKVKAMFALASVAYISKINWLLTLIAPHIQLLELYRKIVGGELFVQRPLIKFMNHNFYILSLLQKKFNTNALLFLVGGYDTAYSDPDLLHQILYHTPAGSSVKTLIHYLQEQNSGRFQYYSYGHKGNLRMYNNTNAPDYDISKINVPIANFRSDNDAAVHIHDLQKFFTKVPHQIIDYRIKDPLFNHLDFVWGKKASKYLYPTLLPLMENYR